MTDQHSLTSEEWTLVKTERPCCEGLYRIKNATMEGVGYFDQFGWAVIGEWSGNITHWAEMPTCQ